MLLLILTLIVLVLGFESRRGEILKLFAKMIQKKDELRAPTGWRKHKTPKFVQMPMSTPLVRVKLKTLKICTRA